jgi:hypothetical protein
MRCESGIAVARVEVASSSLVTRSNIKKSHNHAVCGAFLFGESGALFVLFLPCSANF